jgi:cytochrome b involved in lipid metabolism
VSTIVVHHSSLNICITFVFVLFYHVYSLSVLSSLLRLRYGLTLSASTQLLAQQLPEQLLPPSTRLIYSTSKILTVFAGCGLLLLLAITGQTRLSLATSRNLLQNGSKKCRKSISTSSQVPITASGSSGYYAEGQKAKGGSFKKLKSVKSVQECFTACANLDGCRSFTYTPKSSKCKIQKKSRSKNKKAVFCADSKSVAGVVEPQSKAITGGVSPSVESPSSQLPVYTMSEVATHNTEGDAWVVVSGKVYDISDFISMHPGGSAIKSYMGEDATRKFLSAHSSSDLRYLEETIGAIGVVEGGSSPDPSLPTGGDLDVDSDSDGDDDSDWDDDSDSDGDDDSDEED